MKTSQRILSVLLVAASFIPFAAAAPVQNASIGGGGAKIVSFDMNGGITGEVTLANNRVASAQSASAHISAKKKESGKTVLASINGGYFDSYSGANTTYATVIQNGEVVNGGGNKPTLAFTADGKAIIDRVKIETKLMLRNGEGNGITCYSVNDYNKQPHYVAMITPAYGRALTVQPGARIVTVQNNVIKDIRVGGTISYIPWDVRVFVINQTAWSNLEKYNTAPQVGNYAEIKTVYTPASGDAENWTNIVSGVGAGPHLLSNGVDVCDSNSDFTDPKQKPDVVSSRSFAAVMQDGRLVIGSAQSASMRQIAKYLKAQGAVDAMALDGGASTFLNVGGSTLHSAGRNLSNVLHIVQYSNGQVPQGIQAPDFSTASGWASTDVNGAISAGLIPDSLQTGYRKNITREEFCQLIMPLLKAKISDISKRIVDGGITYDAARAALSDTWNIDIINCYQLGIISGVGNNRFNPNGSLTREQAAKILMGVNELIGASEASRSVNYSDASQISSWATEGVNYVSNHGIMNGSGDKFNPRGFFTREQAILTLYRMYQ